MVAFVNVARKQIVVFGFVLRTQNKADIPIIVLDPFLTATCSELPDRNTQ